MVSCLRSRLYHLPSTPLYDKYVAKLVTAGFTAEEAGKLVTKIDEAAQEKIKREEHKLLPTIKYAEMLNTYQAHVESFRKETLASQHQQQESLKHDHETMLSEISKLRQRLDQELQQLEAGIQLDISLERKRLAEAIAVLEGKSEKAKAYAEEKMRDVQKELQNVSKQAMTTIAGFSGTVLLSIILYALLAR